MLKSISAIIFSVALFAIPACSKVMVRTYEKKNIEIVHMPSQGEGQNELFLIKFKNDELDKFKIVLGDSKITVRQYCMKYKSFCVDVGKEWPANGTVNGDERNTIVIKNSEVESVSMLLTREFTRGSVSIRPGMRIEEILKLLEMTNKNISYEF